jgi:putative salt-induced outer membrane protein YdiY
MRNFRRTAFLVPPGLLLSFLVAFPRVVSGQAVTLHLNGGDRISGRIVSANPNQLVVSNTWAGCVMIPLASVAKCETNPAPTALPTQTGSPPVATASPTSSAPKPALNPPGKPGMTFLGNVRFGFNALFHTRRQQSYFADLKLAAERAYRSDPKKHFRNTTEMRGDYQTTDGEESANRVKGSNKSDVDIWRDLYGYALGGAGFDRVRKIDYQYQIGPGLGHRLFNRKNFSLNVEGGVNYEVQERTEAEDIEAMYLRLGLNSVWQIAPQLKLTQQLAYSPDLMNEDQFHNEFACNLSFTFWKNMSLNLGVLDEYDTQAAPGVEKNRFEIRSSLGYTF